MHRGAAHAKARIARGLAGTQENHDPRPGPALSQGQGQPQVQGGRPDQLWVADFTYVHTAMGTAYAAFVIDVFARKIVGWCVSISMTTSFVLDALYQAVRQRRPAMGSLTHHSDRSMQYLSIRHAERLAEAGIDISVGSVGDSCDYALAETVIGPFKTEVVKHLGPWKTKGRLEWETMKWLHRYNKDRLHGAISYQTPNEKENAFRQQNNKLEKAA